jgi:hypothetical protein
MASKWIESSVLDAITKELASRIGPMAKIKLNQELAKRSFTAAEIPPNKIDEIITALAAHVREEADRGAFVRECQRLSR